ncbi:hypothetical protein D7Y13_06375 [Corallococcus praedator]|uniref:RDD domain-containing protein n=1 Tax=Corallococcus praedator TaxID=2316724 RepID=A0ABX9QP72_9BACT|nr:MULTISPECIES: hypothetical protein [Corallococcus]RKH27046.1 hypothetical protein D7X75_27250 [Corallococcus sp. CA031C]RKI14225.1 hypothetical protein D7Y13_06375 [Corallococcus praedator]
MQFTLSHPPPLAEQILHIMLLALLLVGIPLVLWLRRGPRDGRDVLGFAPASPPSSFQGFQERLGWVCTRLLCLGAVLLGVLFVGDVWRISSKAFGPSGLSSLEGSDAFFALTLLITPWVVIPLVRWLERSPRLGTGLGAQGRIGLAQRLGDLLGWVSVTTVLAVPVLFGMSILASIEESPGCEVMLVNGQPLPPPPEVLSLAPSIPGVIMMVVLTVLVGVLRVWWLRSTSSHQDVLHIEPHTVQP